jgi:hypothetical protein
MGSLSFISAICVILAGLTAFITVRCFIGVLIDSIISELDTFRRHWFKKRQVEIRAEAERLIGGAISPTIKR